MQQSITHNINLLYCSMFRPTQNSQIDIFNNFVSNLPDRKQRMLEDPSGWHNVFFRDTLSYMDESIFSVLYDDKMGRPNASIRDLVGMIILKEGQGWSDQQLFEQCRFNVIVMRALGKANLDEEIPVEATYYDFRRLMIAYNKEHGVDLLKMAFKDVTIKQMKKFGSQGEKIRMDSKLINSNIARSTRLDLIVEAVRKFVIQKDVDIQSLRTVVEAQIYELLVALQSSSTSNILYPMDNGEKKRLLHSLGPAIKAIVKHYKEHQYEGEYLTILYRVFTDQYKEEEENPKGLDDESMEEQKGSHILDNKKVRVKEEETEIKPKDKKEISSSNVQSVHDPEATYREKGQSHNKQSVRGYHGNITELCDEENGLNLIVDGELKTANEGEHSFLTDTVTECEQMMQEVHGTPQAGKSHIKEAISDGGYDDLENRNEMLKPQRPTWRLTKMKGPRQSFHMEYDDQGNLLVLDKSSNQYCEVSKTRKGHKIVIKTPGGKVRYFTPEDIDNYIISQQIQSNQTKESYNLRANVESTINQVFYRLGKSKKVKYRGYHACKNYLFSMILWTNHRRIAKKLTGDSDKMQNLPGNGHIWLENWMRPMIDRVISWIETLWTLRSIITYGVPA